MVRDFNESFKTGVFQVNIINDDAHKSEHLQNLVGSMQGINYLEFISDIASDADKSEDQLSSSTKIVNQVR